MSPADAASLFSAQIDSLNTSPNSKTLNIETPQKQSSFKNHWNNFSNSPQGSYVKSLFGSILVAGICTFIGSVPVEQQKMLRGLIMPARSREIRESMVLPLRSYVLTKTVRPNAGPAFA